MSRAFPQSNIVCFFCQVPASPFLKNPSNFVCLACGAKNGYDINGQIVSNMSATHNESLNRSPLPNQAFLRENQPLASQKPNLFCRSCQSNQRIIMELLSEYLPPHEDSSYDERLTMLSQYRKSLHARYPPVCENCTPAVEGVIREQDRTIRPAAFADALRRGKAGAFPKPDPTIFIKRQNRVISILRWWCLRGALWAMSGLLSLCTYISAILGYKPFVFLNRVQPVLPLLVFLSLIWTVWDPTYYVRCWAEFDERETRLTGKKEYIIFQMTIWGVRLLTSILYWLQWSGHMSGYFEYLNSHSQLRPIYFCTVTVIEVVAQALSFYYLRCEQPLILRVVKGKRVVARSNIPSCSRSRSSTPPATQLHEGPVSASGHDPLPSLSLSSEPVMSPISLSSLLSDPSLKGDSQFIDDDEYAMDWTPTGPVAPKEPEILQFRPATFFGPEKSTGLESLLAKTTLEDDVTAEAEAMAVDEPEKEVVAGNSLLAVLGSFVPVGLGSIILLILVALGNLIRSILSIPMVLGNLIRVALVSHFKKWWRVYARVIGLVVVSALVRRVWRVKVAITSNQERRTFSISMVPVPVSTMISMISPMWTKLTDAII
ncbi:hypothetical protein Ac2012v2_000326 [Leucoagaricus gongylophorus]